MAKRKAKRIGYGVKPPYLSLGGCLPLAERIYQDGGGSISEDQLSAIFANSVTSSSFRRKLDSMKAFGLVTQAPSGARVLLSDRGRLIAGPVSPEDRAAGLKAAFTSLPHHRTLFDFWAGKVLPADDFFLNSIREHCKVPQELVGSWKDSFMDSARAAGLLQQRADGRVQLRREPGSTEEEPMAVADSVERPIRSAPRAPAPREEIEEFSIPLATEGKFGFIKLPRGWTQTDVRKMIHVIEAMFLWEEQQSRPPIQRTAMQ